MAFFLAFSLAFPLAFFRAFFRAFTRATRTASATAEALALLRRHGAPGASMTPVAVAAMPSAVALESTEQDAAQHQQAERMQVVDGAGTGEQVGNCLLYTSDAADE